MKKKLFSLALILLVLLGSTQYIYAKETTVTMPSVALNSNVSLNLEPEQTQVFPFTVAENGTLDVNGIFTSSSDVYIRIYNSDMQQLKDDSSSDYANNAATGQMELSLPLQTTPGTYYLSIRNNSDEINYTNTLNLKFNANQAVSLPAHLTGTLLRNEVAVYQTSISQPTYFYLSGSFADKYAQDFKVLDANGNEIANDDESDWENAKWSKDNSTGLDLLHLKTDTYQPGTYYIKVVNKDKGNLTYALNVSTKNMPKATTTKKKSKKTAVKISASKKKFTLKRKKKKKLKVTVKPKSLASKVRWKTSDKKIATVNKKGTVTAKHKGKCYITASLQGKKVRFTIKVK